LPTAAHGSALDTSSIAVLNILGGDVKHIWTDLPTPTRADANKRGTERRTVALPARLTWKDQRGTTRFATVIARNVSDFGVFVECQSPVSIPLFRLVQFQFERDAREAELSHLQHGRVLSAVYRVSPPVGSRPQGLALRLMVEPRRNVAVEQTRATA
jgi:hypothetical protein